MVIVPDVSPLLQYGVFGLWTIFNIWIIKSLFSNQETQQDKREERYIQVIDKNTQAMTAIAEAVRICPKR